MKLAHLFYLILTSHLFCIFFLNFRILFIFLYSSFLLVIHFIALYFLTLVLPVGYILRTVFIKLNSINVYLVTYMEIIMLGNSFI